MTTQDPRPKAHAGTNASPADRSRRGFLKRGAAVSAGLASPWVMNLSAMAQAAAATTTADDGYKAIVCVFLQGGNDQANTLIPADNANYALYARLRGALALPQASLASTLLTPVAPPAGLPSGLALALAPSLAPLKALFDAQRLAVLLNIGPLVQPTTLAQFKAQSVALPPKLFSHNDQQAMWQSYGAEGSTVGWGGLMGDAALGLNVAAPSLSCLNLAGNAVYLAGQQAGQYMVNPRGPEALLATDASTMNALFGTQGGAACLAAFQALAGTQEPGVHRLAKEHSAIMRRAMASNSLLIEQLAASPIAARAADAPANALADQLNTVARIISVHQQLGAAQGGIKRQVFFVQMGGFDLHDGLLANHPVLLGKLGSALAQFDADLGPGLREQVTTFTASDFGRTITSNGDGSDHGWGSHHFVMGGAVKGCQFYGAWPDVTDFDAGAHNIGQGRLLPTLSVDHLAYQLARWMGVTNANTLAQIAPHWGNFTGVSPLSNLL